MISKTKFGIYGGQFIPETLMPAIKALTVEAGYREDNFIAKGFEA